MSISIEKTGATVELAVEAALVELGVSIEDTVVEVLEESSESEGLGNRPCRVLVTVEDRPVSEVEDGLDISSEHGEEENRAVEFVESVLNHFDIRYKINTCPREDAISVDISGPDCGIVIGRGGETLDALQYLTNLVVNRDRDSVTHVHVDAGGYRRRHEDNLSSLARKTAAKVARYGRTFEMKPMSPADRRIIHAALQSFRGVETFSEGEGDERRVIIAPVSNN